MKNEGQRLFSPLGISNIEYPISNHARGVVNFKLAPPEAGFPISNRAFTLIELLVVMGIMMIMAAIAVTSYFGMTRGYAMRSAVSHLRSTLMLARQTAVMNGKKAYVIFGQDSTNSWYVICRHEGTATYGLGKVMGDKYANWSILPDPDYDPDKYNMYIYNLGNEKRSRLVDRDVDSGINVLTTKDSIWASGDKYGWEIHPKALLPRGIRFGDGTPTNDVPSTVIFNADGTTDARHKINIYETIHSNPGDPHGQVIVKAPTGIVGVEFVE